MSLFWRTFLLIGALLSAALLAALFTFVRLEETPRAQRMGLQVASLVNLTRTALVSAQSQRRIELLDQIARDEGARVRLLEATDKVEVDEPPNYSQRLLFKRLGELLGPSTRFAKSVNGEEAFWVSFSIDTDDYWLGIEPARLLPPPPNFLLLGFGVFSLSMLSAWLLSRVVNRPLQELANAFDQLSKGQDAPILPLDGPRELAELNQQFNRLAKDLLALESDRSLALAGISHDIRTPLTRLRLEIELASQLSLSDQQSMSEEIERIDEIVGQFIDYARSESSIDLASVNINQLIEKTLAPHASLQESGQLVASVTCPPNLTVNTSPVALARMLSNCVSNALRYGERGGIVKLKIQADPSDTKNFASKQFTITVVDDGVGVPETELERLMRPFARLDSERSAVGGSGLGLAIVERLARRLGGSAKLRNHAHTNYRGLCVELRLPIT